MSKDTTSGFEIEMGKQVPPKTKAPATQKVTKPAKSKKSPKTLKTLLEVVKEVFNEHPLVYRTNKNTTGQIRNEFDLYALVRDKIPKGTKIISNMYSQTKSKLLDNQIIIKLNNPSLNLSKKELKKVRNYLKQDSKGDISTIMTKSNANALVLNSSEGKNEIQRILDIITQAKPITPISAPVGVPSVLQEYATFEDQIIHSSKKGIDVSDLYADILTYLENPYYRRCPKCGDAPGNLYYLKFDKWEFKPEFPYAPLTERFTLLANMYFNNEKTWKNEGTTGEYEFFDENSTTVSQIEKRSVSNEADFDDLQDKNYSIFYCWNDNCDFFIQSGGKARFHLFKEMVKRSDSAIWNMLLGLKQGKGVVLFGFPGDGKSTICVHFLDYIYFKFGHNYLTINVDESTTSFQLRGGISPDIFALSDISQVDEKARIEYGLLSMSLLSKDFKKIVETKQGKKEIGIGKEANFFGDEVNRTDFRNISFLMGFYASPYRFVLKEDNSRTFFNPNDIYKETRWISLFTMNTADIGNEPLSLAFKRRFHIVEIRFTIEDIREIFKTIFKTKNESDWRVKVAEEIHTQTGDWKTQRAILFPAGIGHIMSFIKEIELSLEDLTKMEGAELKYRVALKLTGNPEENMANLVDNILSATIINAIVDENSQTKVETIEQKKEDLIKKIVQIFKNKGLIKTPSP